jgi:PAS domain S-box-containing protein
MKTSLSKIAHSLRLVMAACVLNGPAFIGSTPAVAAETAPEIELHTAEQIRSLTPEQAAQRLPVHLKGVITFYDNVLYYQFLQDTTAGIYLQRMTDMPALKSGQLVEVAGFTSPGEYAPVVEPTSITVLGEGTIPPAKKVSLEQLVSGQEDSQMVEVSGIVRAAQFETEIGYYVIDLVMGGERFSIYAKQIPVAQAGDLVDSTVKVRGVCCTLFNRQRQLFGIHLLVANAADLVIDKPALAKPFEIPAQKINSLLQFTPQGAFGHRVKVAGNVVYHEPGSAIFIEDKNEGLYCQTRQRTPVQLGDRVEVLGFPAKGEYTPMLEDASYQKIAVGTEVKPDAVDLNEMLTGTHDCRLVQIEARVLERAQRGRDQFLVLETSGFIFQAYLAQDVNGDGLVNLLNDSEVKVTGICLIERGNNWQAGKDWRAKSFRLLLRSPQDVTVLRYPPWWTLKKVLWIAGALGLATLAAFVWVVVLRRRVRQQTGIIEKRLQMEASLKARYENLFENANDMVFTHDASGKMTSINMAGERLLQQTRENLLARNMVELIAEDQRATARHWLAQIAKDADLPATEWDFVNAAGQRIKLEISSRLIEQDGRTVEIEGIARDITERRRLERELLEISNREQRRIGHDLHDGVCQQLAAIAYLLDILGDQLQEKNQPEFAEAERIGNLINEVNAQARNVARGLFPARLDEHGLIMALEELAGSASVRYRITCRFNCQVASAKFDRDMELHLYYIVQEALLNAVNHGKSTEVIVTLAADGERLKLTVQDNGSGFQLSDKNRSGLGIRIMKYRAKVIGATVELHSELERGTRIECAFNPKFREHQK